MGLFDFFKKGDPAAEKKPVTKTEIHTDVPVMKPKAENVTPVNVPAAGMKQEVRPVYEQKTPPVVQNKERAGKMPTPAARPVDRKEQNASAEMPDKRRGSSQRVYWPRYGTTLSDLMHNRQLRVFVDGSFIAGEQFGSFSALWAAERANGNENCVFFVPGFIKNALTQEQKSLLNSGDYREWYSNSYEECFKSFHTRNRCAIILLTNDIEVGLQAQKAAAESETLLRWYGMDKNGCLCSLSSRESAQEKHPTEKKTTAKPKFQWTDQMIKISRRPGPARAPEKGESVVTCGGRTMLRLLEPVMSNHNSVTYATSDSAYYAKIYTAGNLQIDVWENKADRMLREKIQIPGVCWPVDKLMNQRGEFVGILVPTSRGIQLTRSVLNGATGLNQAFPNWKRVELCTLADTLLSIIMSLHKHGIYFGCLNPAAIYVVSPKEIYLIDVDSWQIESYPCVTRNRTFTPPELIRSSTKQAFFTPDQDSYQVALLIFMIMLPGKFPYALRKSINEEDSIAERSFAFGVGSDMRRSKDSERPQGIWRIVWDHLPYPMCNLFYNTFHVNGKFSAVGTRPNDYEWKRMVAGYQKELEACGDADRNAIFPKTFRRDGKRVFVKCSSCGQEHPEFYFLKNIHVNNQRVDIWSSGYRVCLPCAADRSDKSFTCECCHRTFYYTNRTKLMHEIGKSEFGWNNQKWCSDCKKRKKPCPNCGKEVPIYQMKEFTDRRRNLTRTVCSGCFGELINEEKRSRELWKNTVNRYVTCKVCRRQFSLSNGDVEYFQKKGLNLPSRCPNCRGRR